MSRTDKAALRAENRERRRRPADDSPEDEQLSRDDGRREEKPRPERKRPRGTGGGEIAEIAEHARELLRSVRGVEAESVSAVARTPDGWRVALEVVELRRIPDSTDVLASYEVELDDKGGFLGFERGRRYNRSQAEGGDGR